MTNNGRARQGTVVPLLFILLHSWAALASHSQAPSSVTTRPTSLLQNITQTDVNSTGKKRRKRSKRQGAATQAPQASLERRTTESNKAGHGVLIKKKKKKKPEKPVKSVKETGGREADCLRRIKREWRDAVKLGIAYDWMKMTTLGASSDKYAYVRIGPLGKNLLLWHFSVMGPPNSEYEGGIYHGRVLLPKSYPSSPPRIQVLTPSGRFITGEDICLSASAFHPESWTPRWTVLSLVEALRLHMITTANEIGGKDDTPEQRRKYARASRQWHRGRIDHGVMVRDGIFPWQNDTEDIVEKQVIVDGESGVQVAVKRTADVPVRKRVPQNARLPSILIRAVVEVLTSPPRLALLLLLTVFVILNRR